MGLYKTLARSQGETMSNDNEWMSPEEMLKMLGTSAADIEDAYNAGELETRNTKIDKRVCACGHRVAAHTEIAGVTFCKPARMECPCKKCRPVLEAEDTRVFLRSTRGGGRLHALSQGLYALLQREKKVRWIIEFKCDRCGASTGKPLTPVPVTQSGIATTYPTGYDALLCDECRTSV